MFIINKKYKTIINTNNIIAIGIDEISAETIKEVDVCGKKITIARYESEEVCKKAFNSLIEGIEKKEDVFYMPE